jgi:photosystem II stability/assembly factor-like uncharacterized protein
MSARTLFTIGAALSMGAAALPSQARQPEDPWAREEYFRRQLAYPHAEIPGGALRRMMEISLERARQGTGFASAIFGGSFVPLGPAGLLAQDGFWTSGQQLDAGRVSKIAIHPSNRDTWYVSTAGGGVWKTTNAGASWVPLTESECVLHMGAVAIDPVDPSIVYAGTGELNTSSFGCGVLRTANGGSNWTTFTSSAMTSTLGVHIPVGSIHIDPVTAGSAASTTVLMGTIWGVFRSTNSGVTWTRVLPTGATARADNVVQHPGNPDVLYTGLGLGSQAGVYRSGDKGVSWSMLPFPPGMSASSIYRLALATSPADPQKVWVFVAGLGSNNAYNLIGGYVWNDATSQWTTLDVSGVYISGISRGDFGGQAWYDFVLGVDPSDASRIFVGGVRLFRSTNGGNSWQRIAMEIHVDWHALAFDPVDSRRMIGGNDGGVFLSLDGGDTWTSRNYGLAITQYYPGIALHPTNAANVVGGSQDNGSHQYFGMPVWQGITGGDGGYAAFNHQNPAIIWTTCQWGPCIFRKNPTSGIWSSRSNGISFSDRAQFIPPLVMDPTTATTLYFGTQKLYRTTDDGVSWIALANGLDLSKGSGTITAIAPSRSQPLTVYVGLSDGSVRVTHDGGTTFNPIGTGFPNVFVTDIAVDPQNPLVAWVVTSTFGTPHVFKTTDGGASWGPVAGTLPDIPVFAIAYVPSENVLIIGTQLGVYQSGDGGATWSAGPAGIPMLPVRDLAYNATTNVVVAATHGRGMFMLRTAAATPVLRGDVDRDGAITANDALLIQRALVGRALGADDSGTPFVALPWGDANCNGTLEALDALLTLRQSVGLPVTGCVGTSAARASK